MPYIIGSSDGTITYTLQDGTVDESTFSLGMVGKGVTNYAEVFAENTLHLLENFASATSPENPIIGQMWYDKVSAIVRVWDGNIFRASTGVSVGPEQSRPTENLSGTTFFNTTTNKLEVHDGTRYKEVAYAGEVTSRYSSSSAVQNPTFYGARIRTLFLKSEDNRDIPVLAFSYVNSGNNPANRGATKIGEQYETIMALYSDSEFYIRDTSNGGTSTLVDGVIVDFAPELIATAENGATPVGIAAARTGREGGQILKGSNTRAEYEDTSVAFFNLLYANVIGTSIDPVSTINVQDLNVLNSVTLVQDLTVSGTIVGESDANILGTIYASGSNSDDWANSVLIGQNVSLLVNDVSYLTPDGANTFLDTYGYVTESQLNSVLNIVDISEILTTSSNVSELINDAGYLSGVDLAGGLGIDYDSGSGTLSLANTAVTPGTYGSGTLIPSITIDQQGRITNAATVSIAGSIALTDLSVTTLAASGAGSLSYNNTNGIFTFRPADLPSDVADLTDVGSIIPSDVSDLTDVGSSIPTTLLDLGISEGTNGQVLSTNGAGTYTFTSQGAIPNVLGDLTDVAATVPTSGQVLAFSTGAWRPTTIGGGDVTGPVSATNNAVVLFNGTTGKIIKNSAKTLPSGAIVGTSDGQTLSGKSFSDFLRLSGGSGTTDIRIGTNNAMAFRVNSTDQMVIETGGDVGIGFTNPAYKLHVNGIIYSTNDIIAFSDKRIKKNVETLDGSKVLEMRGVSYNRIDEGTPSSGVIAQEIEEVAPELVHTGPDGMKAVAYGNLVGYLIEGVKELNNQIEMLKAEIKELKNAPTNNR